MNILKFFGPNESNAASKPVPKLEVDSSVQNRLNLSKFQADQGKSGNTKTSGSAEDELLMYTSKPLTTSLLRMSHSEAQSAVEMFKTILDYLHLTNGPSNRKRRESIVQKICDKGRLSPLKDEMYLQLLKQTRGNTNAAQEKNAWKLFLTIAASLPCPEDLVGVVSKYTMSVCLDKDEDPLIRSMAFKILSTLKDSLQSQSAARQQLSAKVFNCNVFLMDGSFYEVVYNSKITVSGAIQQLVWSLGLRKPKHFALYIDSGNDHVRLDEDSSLADVVPSGNNAQERLLFKKEFFTGKDKHISDPDYVYYCYIQSKRQYLDGGCPVQKEQAATLSFLQISADNEPSIFKDEQALSEAIARSVPKKFFVERKPAEWNQDVLQCLEKLGPMTQIQAQMQFLTDIRRSPYGNCVFFRVWTKGYFPVDLPNHTELKLGINYHSLCFFQPGMEQCLESIDASNVLLCMFSGREVTMKTGRITEWCCFQLESDHAKEICKAVNIHKREFQRSKTTISAAKHAKILSNIVTDMPSPDIIKAKSAPAKEIEAEISESASSLYETDDETVSDMQTPSTEGLPQQYGGQMLQKEASIEVWRQLQSVEKTSASTKAFNQAKNKLRTIRQRQRQRRQVKMDWDLSLQPAEEDSEPSSPAGTMTEQEQINSYSAEAQPLSVEADTEKTKWTLYEETTLPLDSLDSLKPGRYFTKRYKIKSERVGLDKFLAQDIKTRHKVLLKFYSSTSQFEKSLAFHRRLSKSPYVCRLLDVIRQVGYPLCLVFERGDETLYQYLEKEQPSTEERKSTLKQILLGLADIHSQGFVHCDLRPSNVMLFRSVNKWKLLEFDSASPASRSTQTSTTVTYAAPEVAQAEREGKTEIIPHASADLFALGVIAFELLTGQRIYGEDATAGKVREALLADEPLPGLANLEDDQSHGFIEKLLQKDPRDRLSAQRALAQSFFAVEASSSF